MSVFSIVFIFYFISNKGLQPVTRTPPGSTQLTVASGPTVQVLLVTAPPPWDPCTRQTWRWGERLCYNELTRWIWAELAMRSIEVDGDRNMDKICSRKGRQPSYCKIPGFPNVGSELVILWIMPNYSFVIQLHEIIIILTDHVYPGKSEDVRNQ